MEDGVPVTLLTLGFLSAPAAPNAAADPNLPRPKAAADAFLFFSKTIFARATVSIGAALACSSSCPDTVADAPAMDFLPTVALLTRPPFTTGLRLEGDAERFKTGGLGDRLLAGCCSLVACDVPAGPAGDAAVVALAVLPLLSYRL